MSRRRNNDKSVNTLTVRDTLLCARQLMASSRPAVHLARRVTQSAVAKKIAGQCRVQVVGEPVADYYLPDVKIAVNVFDIPYNMTESTFEETLATLVKLAREYPRRCVSQAANPSLTCIYTASPCCWSCSWKALR